MITQYQRYIATIYYSPCGFETPISTGIDAVISGPVDATTQNCTVHVATDFSFTQSILLSVQIALIEGVTTLADGIAVLIEMQV